MKKFSLLLLCVFLLLASTVYAHPGRTDANGGHYDRSTGEYHYHHGYPAHQHYDIDGDGTIDCPYDFKDNTDHTSRSSGSSSSSSSVSRSSTPDETELSRVTAEAAKTDPKKVEQSVKRTSLWKIIKSFFEYLFLGLVGLFCFAFVAAIVYGIIAGCIIEPIKRKRNRKK